MVDQAPDISPPWTAVFDVVYPGEHSYQGWSNNRHRLLRYSYTPNRKVHRCTIPPKGTGLNGRVALTIADGAPKLATRKCTRSPEILAVVSQGLKSLDCHTGSGATQSSTQLKKFKLRHCLRQVDNRIIVDSLGLTVIAGESNAEALHLLERKEKRKNWVPWVSCIHPEAWQRVLFRSRGEANGLQLSSTAPRNICKQSSPSSYMTQRGVRLGSSNEGGRVSFSMNTKRPRRLRRSGTTPRASCVNGESVSRVRSALRFAVSTNLETAAAVAGSRGVR